MPFTCIILDSDTSLSQELNRVLEAVNQIDCLGTFEDLNQILPLLKSTKIDLLIGDLVLTSLLNSETYKGLLHQPKVILTISSTSFSLDTFNLDILDYVSTPLSPYRFLKAIDKFLKIQALESADTNYPNRGFLYVRNQRKMVKVFLNDILYIESLKDYVLIHRENTAKLKVKLTLCAIMCLLPKYLFLRTHRSFIIATDKITAYTHSEIELGKALIPIGKSYAYVIHLLPKGQIGV